MYILRSLSSLSRFQSARARARRRTRTHTHTHTVHGGRRAPVRAGAVLRACGAAENGGDGGAVGG